MLRKRDSFILNFSVTPLLFLSVLALLRLVFCFEFDFTYEVEFFDGIYMDIINFLFIPSISLPFTVFQPCVAHLLLLVWVVGSMFLLADTCRGMRKGRRLLQETYIVEDEEISIFVKNHLPSLKSGREVRVLEADWVETPMITGILRPTVLLPLIEFDEHELKGILKHECKHFENKDLWIKLYIRAIVIIFWWNPFAHLLENNLNHILEVRCDIEVTKNMDEEGKTAYLATILKIVKIQRERLERQNKYRLDSKNPAFAYLVSAKQEKKLVQRFSLVSSAITGTQNKRGKCALCLAMLLVFFSSYLVVFQAAGSAPEYEDGYEIMDEPFQEGAYLIKVDDGTYHIYTKEGEFKASIYDRTIEPFCNLEVREINEVNKEVITYEN